MSRLYSYGQLMIHIFTVSFVIARLWADVTSLYAARILLRTNRMSAER